MEAIVDEEIIPNHYTPAYVIVSYMVSYLGSWTTLELLYRRTASSGAYNWFILIGSSATMGGIAVWGMHFIGNRAMVMGDGAEELQLSYNTAFTAISFFVPILDLLIAFAVVGGSDKAFSVFRVIFGGLLAGIGAVGMHYLGQAGIANYTCTYDVAHLIGAALLAIVASIFAIGTFSYFRHSWAVKWWVRTSCAVILAAAVSGMHWVASRGTLYHWKKKEPGDTDSYSRSNTLIGVVVLSVSACVFLLLFSVLGQRRVDKYKNKAQQVALAVAVFDEDGRIMVTPDGHLPQRKITNNYVERSIEDVFGISHPLFIWIFRTAFDWNGVKNLIPAMKSHVHRAGVKGRRGPNDSKLLSDQGTPVEDYAILFRDLFCIAASELSDDFHLPLEQIGILYDDIVATGRTPTERSTTKEKLLDLEREALMQDVAGSGQLLFLVKEADLRLAYRLQSAGYRFADPEKVIGLLASGVQMHEKALLERLGSIRDYVRTDHNLDAGVHFACFTIRASLQAGRGGFEILARKDARNLLPTMQLPFDRIEPWQIEFLKDFDGMTVVATARLLRKATMPSNPFKEKRDFAKDLLSTLEAFKEEINDPFFNDASFVSKPIEAPCRGDTDSSPPGTAILLTFKIIVPIQARAPGKKLEFVPVNFFKMQQYVYLNSTDHLVFARRTHLEFAPALGLNESGKSVNQSKTPPMSGIMRTPVATETDATDKKTYVDELFAICIATRK